MWLVASHVHTLEMCVHTPFQPHQSLPGVHLMNTINHTSVVKYTVGGTTRSIVGSISRSDLHHRVLQLQHINIEPQAQALLFSAQRCPKIKAREKKHLMFGKNLIGKHSCIGLCGVFTHFALSPLHARLLFSFMKINETVQPAAEASRAPPDWGGLQASSHFSCMLSWQFRESQGVQHWRGMTIRKRGQKKRKWLMQNANHIAVSVTRSEKDKLGGNGNLGPQSLWRTKELMGKKSWQKGIVRERIYKWRTQLAISATKLVGSYL